MSRAWTFVSIGLVLLATIYLQDVAIRLLGPESTMWAMVVDITWPVNGEEWARELYVAITVWFIWIIRVGVVVIGLYREFLRQNVTGAARGAPR